MGEGGWGGFGRGAEDDIHDLAEAGKGFGGDFCLGKGEAGLVR